jgi:hypothetical protein
MRNADVVLKTHHRIPIAKKDGLSSSKDSMICMGTWYCAMASLSGAALCISGNQCRGYRVGGQCLNCVEDSVGSSWFSIIKSRVPDIARVDFPSPFRSAGAFKITWWAQLSSGIVRDGVGSAGELDQSTVGVVGAELLPAEE